MAIAYVEYDGTFMTAYDRDGHEISSYQFSGVGFELVSWTSDTIVVGDGSYITTYDENFHEISSRNVVK